LIALPDQLNIDRIFLTVAEDDILYYQLQLH
jgi:hypothetical protein